MASAITDTWIQSRIDSTKATIESIEDAILALSTGKYQSYTIDTGQTRQSVTKKDISRLNVELDKLYSRLDYLDTKLNGSGKTMVRSA
jgi:hypothetical protein